MSHPQAAPRRDRHPVRPHRLWSIAALAAMLLATPGPSALADDEPSRDAERPLLEGWPDEFFDPEKFDRQKLSDEARRAVEDFLALVGPLMDRLSIAIEDLPRYEAPVILPNGDILIRRKRDPEEEAPLAPDEPETEGESDDPRRRPDGSYDL